MASPIVESLCCVPISTDLTQHILNTFHTSQYNVVCLVASLLGMAGATFQLAILQGPLQSPSFTQLRSCRPHMLRTKGRFIVRWLAVADLCAASGIALRSVLWLWDVSAATGGPEPLEVSFGRMSCVILASWIHYFYTCTYMWTCLYCIDCVRTIRNVGGIGGSGGCTVPCYHALGWLVPALLSFLGLMGLYSPDLQCHSSANPYMRFLPNYLSTLLPLLVVLCVCPALYCCAARQLHTLVASITGRYTTTERALVNGIKRRFLVLCLVFWVCWLPNVVHATFLWVAWGELPIGVLTGLWYIMAALNPLQAVFNSFVYPSQSVRSAASRRRRRESPGCLEQAMSCWWGGGDKAADRSALTDTDLPEQHEYHELSSSEYQSASSSPRILGGSSSTPSDETVPLLSTARREYVTRL